MSKDITSEQLDGYFLLEQALYHGLAIQYLPGQLLVAWNRKDPSKKLSFVHSVGESTKISTVTFVLQKRFRRALLESSKILIPPGATFSFSAKQDPINYANRIGYPVVVKEVFGENPSYSVKSVADDNALLAAAEKVRAHLPFASERAPSSYAQTINLSSSTEEDGVRLKSATARYLVEKQIKGKWFRVYVIGGRGIESGLSKQFEKYIECEIESSVKYLAEEVVSAISGIENAAVDIIKIDNKRSYVVEISERLRLPKNYTGSERLYRRLAKELLIYESTRTGVELAENEGVKRAHIELVGVKDKSNVSAFLTGILRGGGYELYPGNEAVDTMRLDLSGGAELQAQVIHSLTGSHASYVKLL